MTDEGFLAAADLYSESWHDSRRWTQRWSMRALLATFAALGKPDSFLGLGCGRGHLVEFAAGMRIVSVGVDIVEPKRSRLVDQDPPLFMRHDLTLPLISDVASNLLFAGRLRSIYLSQRRTLCLKRSRGTWLSTSSLVPRPGSRWLWSHQREVCQLVAQATCEPWAAIAQT